MVKMDDLFNRFFKTKKINGECWLGVMLDLDDDGNCITQIIALQKDGEGVTYFCN